MDPLDRLAGPAADLLAHVDELIADLGAPHGHRIWPLMRRLRVLPGEAVAAVAALRPAPFAAAGGSVRALLPEYDVAIEALAAPPEWQGGCADGYAAHRAALARYVAGSGESLIQRIDTTAGYADSLADWVSRTRLDLARTLARVLGSAEAVAVVAEGAGGGSTPGVLAAAEIGAEVLDTLARAYDEGASIPARWASSQDELVYRGPAAGPGGPGGDLRLAL
jgi:hypothetical protein